jgi:hypothetical protein
MLNLTITLPVVGEGHRVLDVRTDAERTAQKAAVDHTRGPPEPE